MQFYETVPVGTNSTITKSQAEFDIHLKVNGVEEILQCADTITGTVPAGCWFIPHSMNPGDQIELTASADKLPEITASTTIPAELPAFQCNRTLENLSVTFTDDTDEESLYGLGMIIEATVSGPDDYLNTGIYLATPATEDSGIFNSSLKNDFVDVKFNGWAFGYSKSIIRLWSKAGGQETTLSMKYKDNIYIPAIAGTFHVKARYKVRLYRFSRAFYNYAVALDNIENNTFAQIGIAPATYAYSNINKGLGILAGWTMAETDWFTEKTYSYEKD